MTNISEMNGVKSAVIAETRIALDKLKVVRKSLAVCRLAQNQLHATARFVNRGRIARLEIEERAALAELDRLDADLAALLGW